MAVAIVQSVAAHSDTKVSTLSSPSLTVTAGNVLYVALSVASTSVRDGAFPQGFGLTYTNIYDTDNSPSGLMLWRATVTSPSPNPDTVDFAWVNQSQASVCVVEVSGGTHNKSAIATGSGSPSNVSLTTDYDGSMILAFMAKAGNEAITPDADYTEQLEEKSEGGAIYERETIHVQYRTLSTAASDTASTSGTWGSLSKYWVAAAVEIKTSVLTVSPSALAATATLNVPTVAVQTSPPALVGTMAFFVPTTSLTADITVYPDALVLTMATFEPSLFPSPVPVLDLTMVLSAPSITPTLFVVLHAGARDLALISEERDTQLRSRHRDTSLISEDR